MNKRIGAVATATATLSGLLVALPAVANAGCVSDRGYIYTVTKNYGKVLDGTGTLYTYKNYGVGTTTVTASSTTTYSTAVDWSVNASISGTGGYDFGVIKASVQGTLGTSISYTTSSSVQGSLSVSMSVPAGDYAVYQDGLMRQKTYGHYYYDNGNCTYTAGSYITTKLVIPGKAAASAVNTTGNVPWDERSSNN